MKKLAPLALILCWATLINGQADKIVPSFEQVLSLKSVGYTPVISPDGKHVIFTVT